MLSFVFVYVIMVTLVTCHHPRLPPRISPREAIDESFRESMHHFNRSFLDRAIQSLPNYQELVAEPENEGFVQKEARLAELAIDIIQRVSSKLGMPKRNTYLDERLHSMISLKFHGVCHDRVHNITCDPAYPFRSIDGSCNNIVHPSWGMAGDQQLRYLHPSYEDEVNMPRVHARDGSMLPSPRTVSNIVHSVHGDAPRHHRLSAMLMTWGQFIKHDLVNTPVMRKPDGSSYNCCTRDKQDPACFPILVELPDAQFHNSCMNFVRSSPSVGPKCHFGGRQVMNKVTAFLDASAVYGSDKETESSLRSYVKGTLVTGEYNLLPGSGTNSCIRKHASDKCQRAGDERVNVIPSVGALHTLFMREHNRIAEKLSEINKHWEDERLYQETRKIISALVQHITFNEYLPVVLGHEVMEYYGLIDLEFGHNHVYNDSLHPGIADAFASAAMRFGHSTIVSQMFYLGPDFTARRGVNIEDTYHRPYYMLRYRNYGYEGIMRWLVSDPVPNIDRNFESGVRDHLFEIGNTGFDLPALNVQRGRDHGIPPYNQWRELCGFKPALHFDVNETGLSDHNLDDAKRLQNAYKSPDDIDLYTGGLTERHVPGAMVGPTFACILARQFHDLKYGDRFWYENRDFYTGFTQEQLDSLKDVVLAQIICSNMDIPEIQRNVFMVPKPHTHMRRFIRCSQLPDIDFYAWRDIKPIWSAPRESNTDMLKLEKARLPGGKVGSVIEESVWKKINVTYNDTDTEPLDLFNETADLFSGSSTPTTTPEIPQPELFPSDMADTLFARPIFEPSNVTLEETQENVNVVWN